VIVAYLAIVAAEEEFLCGRFGAEYARYCRDVRRFVPARSEPRGAFRGLRFDWRRLLRKEYGATFAWMTATIVALVWERVARGEGDAVRAHWTAWAGLWGALVIAYLVVRALKKTGRLAT
jgi:hypothetical protein